MATEAAHHEERRSMDAVYVRRPWIAAALSFVLPGLGHLYLRKYVRALAWFSPILAAMVFAVLARDLSIADLVDAALSTTVLWGVFWLNIAGALWRMSAAVDAYRLVEHGPSGQNSAVVLAVGWAILTMLIVTPHLVVGRYTLDALSLVTSIFVAEGSIADLEPLIPIGTDADIVPDPTATTVPEVVGDQVAEVVTPQYVSIVDETLWDPGVTSAPTRSAGGPGPGAVAPFPPLSDRIGERRITILIAGGDAGPGRGGLRTDSMIVASIHTGTGTAALFSFPRNLGSIPLPRKFQSAFVDMEKRLFPVPEPVEEGAPPVEWQSCACFPEQMNAIYPFTRKWRSTYPNEVDPGMAALRDVIEGLMGINIDYYILVDMAAFVDLVDAIGGVDVYVQKPLQSEVSPPREGDPWAKVDVDVGWNHLNGPQALAYSRARKGSSDYARMQRQRCMLRAVAAKSDPITLLLNFPAIADAVERSVVTDIPRSFVSEFIGAAANLDFGDIQTVGFTHAYWLAERDALAHPIPDVDKIRSKVRRVLADADGGHAVDVVDSECDA